VARGGGGLRFGGGGGRSPGLVIITYRSTDGAMVIKCMAPFHFRTVLINNKIRRRI
jgi:hypothetical protein